MRRPTPSPSSAAENVVVFFRTRVVLESAMDSLTRVKPSRATVWHVALAGITVVFVMRPR